MKRFLEKRSEDNRKALSIYGVVKPRMNWYLLHKEGTCNKVIGKSNMN